VTDTENRCLVVWSCPEGGVGVTSRSAWGAAALCLAAGPWDWP